MKHSMEYTDLNNVLKFAVKNVNLGVLRNDDK